MRGVAGGPAKRVKQCARRGCLQIVDDMRLDARIANHRKRVARRAAFRIVVDDDVGGHSADSARAVEPSVRTISLSFRSITITSMLQRGSARNCEMRFDRNWKNGSANV